MRHIVVLGDSLTEQGYASGWVSQLSNAYIRRAGVINGGLSGYNSRWLKEALLTAELRQRWLPSSLLEETPPLFATLLIGSNDCASNEQHVPLEEFKENIQAVVEFVLTTWKPVGGVFVVTLPPIMEEVWAATNGLNRTLKDCRAYRTATLEAVAGKEDVHVVDFHTVMLGYSREEGWDGSGEVPYDPAAPYGALLRDGLHLNEKGGALLFETLMQAVRSSPKAKKISEKKLSMLAPYWGEVCKKDGKTGE
ncbi:GDSL-like Lipase/Acylhydrolase/GDSL-like Lipase/Acylhydrolase family, putative [Angomonas deanei]|uniref:GDSL-like Lipase/Acylhydrolase/GDSL-like Lipase/Acylhydrolase family, putative n=1 Tax=Angomonas deanei TaxID=59799 RepID=A0A7G2CRB5_9TRYP|nr:GDSL-like Lipase/Acylhydrolase/GDSL-like Lipase/Acylhydrolase family, putative [Angomonas deanei]